MKAAAGVIVFWASVCLSLEVRDREAQFAYVRNKPVRRNTTLDYYAGLQEDASHFRKVLNSILIPRPSGSSGNEAVRQFIASTLRDLGWTVQFDQFIDNTPKGRVQFTNIIATLNPSAPRRLIVSAHYDSMLKPKGFLGATDSAVPCAQMLNLAHVMQMDLKAHKQKPVQDVTLQFVFFDGEEAVVRWSDTDSIYGARHLAKAWESRDLLQGIDILLLMDLLGAKSPKISSLDRKTHGWYELLADIESRINQKYSHLPQDRIFNSRARAANNNIGDDHIPFFERGVPTLHLIASPFPSVWHKISDDASAIDEPTVEKLNKIMRVFVAEYLKLDP